MKPLPSRSRNHPRLNPFEVARYLLEDLLPPEDPMYSKVLGMIRARDVPTLAKLGEILDHEYHDQDMWSVATLRRIAALFKKNDAFADDDRCSKAAQFSFERAERICRITNRRLDHFYTHRDRLPSDVNRWMSRMEQDVSFLLGDTCEFTDAMPELIRLTNGATEDRTRATSLPFKKITKVLRGPHAAVPYVGALLEKYGVEFSSCTYECVERNAIVLVPKNWKTHRTIAKEPTHSLPFQLALDQYLKRKLRRWGVDLSSQGKNQDLARLGSLDGSFATIDLEMASDTLSFNAVGWLLPFEWFELLKSFRSSCYVAPWGSGVYSKFSSMGNGYTFSLETLIFAAACRAVGCQQWAVYGDDMCVETRHVTDLVRLLTFLGFRVNGAKSFISADSRFRESCGCDYYKGDLITPFYMRELPRLDDRPSVSHALNGLIASCYGSGRVWTWASRLCADLGLRIVPFNGDSRSGVWMTPNGAWRSGRLRTSRTRHEDPSRSQNFGFPVFRGYGPVQTRRETRGERSLFLWFLQKNRQIGESQPRSLKQRGSDVLLALNAVALSDMGCDTTVTSRVIVRTRYLHKNEVRYSPAPMTPAYLFLWDEVVSGIGTPRKPRT